MHKLPARLLSKLQKSDEVFNGTSCWLWTGRLERDGYARTWHKEKNRPAHRVIYELLVAEVPSHLQMDHLCRVRHCCNPRHLEPVTPKENIRRSDLAKRGEHQRRKTHCLHGHEYTESNTHKRKGGGRTCRQCLSNKAKAKYAGGPGSGSVNRNKEQCPLGHEYTPENTRVYRNGRYCRACAKIKNDARYR